MPPRIDPLGAFIGLTLVFIILCIILVGASTLL